MNMHPDRKQQLDEQWLDSLLTQAYQPDTRCNERIAAVMQQLDVQPQPAQVPARKPWYSLQNLSALAIAASLLVLATFVMDNSQQRAYAAVERSAKPVAQIRLYRLHMISHRPGIGKREMSGDLYIDPANRFLLKHPGMLGFGTAWIGGDANQRWIAPPRGPVIVGGEEIVGRWLRNQELPSPYLHLSTMLQRMNNEYALTMLDHVELSSSSGHQTLCTHVRGDLRQPRPGMPRTIELWADAESGVAQKVILHWSPLPNRRGPARWTIELIETPQNLPKNWFEIDGHAAGRPIVRARNSNELEQNFNQETLSR